MPDTRNRNSIPIVIVTGFLGAGKTSFLSQLLSVDGMEKSAVIINEFGEFGLDHLLVEHVNDQVIDLPDGCLCCSTHNELTEKLADLLADRKSGNKTFDRVIIETSGLSDPGNLMASIWKTSGIRDHYHISKAITLISAIDWIKIKSKYSEVTRQLGVSDSIIISKIDLLPEFSRAQEIAYLQSELKAIASHSKCYLLPLENDQLIEIANSSISPEVGYSPEPGSHHHLDGYKTLTLTHSTPIPMDTVEKFMDALANNYPDDLLRVKGFVLAAENPKKPLLVQSVKTTVSPTVWLKRWNLAPQTRLTIIHTGEIGKQIVDLFYGFTNTIMTDRADKTALTENPLSIPGIGKFNWKA